MPVPLAQSRLISRGSIILVNDLFIGISDCAMVNIASGHILCGLRGMELAHADHLRTPCFSTGGFHTDTTDNIPAGAICLVGEDVTPDLAGVHLFRLRDGLHYASSDCGIPGGLDTTYCYVTQNGRICRTGNTTRMLWANWRWREENE